MFGVFASDALIIALLLVVFSVTGVNDEFLYSLLRNPFVASIGGGILIVMGIYDLRKKNRVRVPSKSSQDKIKSCYKRKPSQRTNFINGFVLNLCNPLVWIYWVSVTVLVSGELSIPTANMYLFFIGVLATTCGLDLLKCKLASLLQKVITARVLDIFNKVTACILFVFAGYLIVSMLRFNLDPEAKGKQLEQDKKNSSTQIIKDMHKKMGDHKTLHFFDE